MFKCPKYKWSASRWGGWMNVHVMRMSCVSVDHSVGRWVSSDSWKKHSQWNAKDPRIVQQTCQQFFKGDQHAAKRVPKGCQKSTNIRHNEPRAFQKLPPWKNIDGSVVKHLLFNRTWLAKLLILGAILVSEIVQIRWENYLQINPNWWTTESHIAAKPMHFLERWSCQKHASNNIFNVFWRLRVWKVDQQVTKITVYSMLEKLT